MKALLIPLAAGAMLAGCATYGDPYGYGYGTTTAYPSVGVYPNTVYPNTVYPNAVYPNTVYGNVYGSYPAAPTYGTRGMRDRDGDGIPNRVDPDRDNDGIPNNLDAHPNNPRRR